MNGPQITKAQGMEKPLTTCLLLCSNANTFPPGVLLGSPNSFSLQIYLHSEELGCRGAETDICQLFLLRTKSLTRWEWSICKGDNMIGKKSLFPQGNYSYAQVLPLEAESRGG